MPTTHSATARPSQCSLSQAVSPLLSSLVHNPHSQLTAPRTQPSSTLNMELAKLPMHFLLSYCSQMKMAQADVSNLRTLSSEKAGSAAAQPASLPADMVYFSLMVTCTDMGVTSTV